MVVELYAHVDLNQVHEPAHPEDFSQRIGYFHIVEDKHKLVAGFKAYKE